MIRLSVSLAPGLSKAGLTPHSLPRKFCKSSHPMAEVDTSVPTSYVFSVVKFTFTRLVGKFGGSRYSLARVCLDNCQVLESGLEY